MISSPHPYTTNGRVVYPVSPRWTTCAQTSAKVSFTAAGALICLARTKGTKKTKTKEIWLAASSRDRKCNHSKVLVSNVGLCFFQSSIWGGLANFESIPYTEKAIQKPSKDSSAEKRAFLVDQFTRVPPSNWCNSTEASWVRLESSLHNWVFIDITYQRFCVTKISNSNSAHCWEKMSILPYIPIANEKKPAVSVGSSLKNTIEMTIRPPLERIWLSKILFLLDKANDYQVTLPIQKWWRGEFMWCSPTKLSKHK